VELLIVEVLALLTAWRSLDRVVHAQLCISTFVSCRNAPANARSQEVPARVLLAHTLAQGTFSSRPEYYCANARSQGGAWGCLLKTECDRDVGTWLSSSGAKLTSATAASVADRVKVALRVGILLHHTSKHAQAQADTISELRGKAHGPTS